VMSSAPKRNPSRAFRRFSARRSPEGESPL
jgi:hypothetical protein